MRIASILCRKAFSKRCPQELTDKLNAKLFGGGLPKRKERLVEASLDTNRLVMWREIKNDMIQLPLKITAWKLSGNPTGPFYAEMVRAGIDFLNHVSLLATSYINLKPSSSYPYGLQKVKNLIVCLPALFFVFCGVQNIVEIYEEEAPLTHPSFYSLGIYVTSLCVQFYVVARNIKDASRLSPSGGQSKSTAQFFRSLIKGKDPLLQTVLYENAITISSTLVPLLMEGLQYFLQTPLSKYGNFLIGLIELYIGTHILTNNLFVFTGIKSVEKYTVDVIKQICKENRFVEEVARVEAIPIGSLQFRFTCHVTLNLPQLQQFLLEEYAHSVEQVSYLTSDYQKQQFVRELIDVTAVRVFRVVQKELSVVEEAIVKQYPECTYIDIELDHSIDKVHVSSPRTLLAMNEQISPQPYMLEYSPPPFSPSGAEDDLRYLVFSSRIRSSH